MSPRPEPTGDYTVVWVTGIYPFDELAEKVARKIAQGWHPQGGISVCGSLDSASLIVSQAMSRG
jgi:hypothetical protein